MKQEFQDKYLEAMRVEELCYEKLTKISPEFADINLIGCSVSRVFEKYALHCLQRRKNSTKLNSNIAKKFAREHKNALLQTKRQASEDFRMAESIYTRFLFVDIITTYERINE